MSKKDDEINRQLIFNSGGANPEDYLTPKQLQRYNEKRERFIDIDMDLAMFTPGSDDDRTDTYEAQKKLQEDDLTAEQEFDEAQQGLRDANTWLQRTLGVAGEFTDQLDNLFGLSRSDFQKAYDINRVNNKQIPKYSSGPIVQTEQGPLYRATDLTSTFMTTTGGSEDQPKKKPLPPKVTTNEKMKEALLNDEAIILNPTYRGGKITVRNEADFFDVSAALIGPGQETKRDHKGRKFVYDRKGVTEFGGVKGPQRDRIYKHLQEKLGPKNITRTEFNKYAKEQIEAEKDLRKAIKLLNLRNYASMKNIDLSEYPTKEAQLEFLNFINKKKRAKDPFYSDYKETFDYGHIISAKTGFRIEDLGMNRISNTEIESARNIESRDPYTQKIIEILQEGNRERGSRRDFIPIVQQMRNTAGSVVEDFVKWKSNQPGAKGTNITQILDKFLPRDQHENYLKFVEKRFYEKRKLSGSLKTFMENELGIPYSEFKNMNNKLQLKIRRMYEQDIVESGNVIGRQQYDQAEMWMRDAIDEFIGLHHFSTPKKLRTTKEMGDLYDMSEDLLPRDIDTLLDMILPDSIDE